MVSSERIAGVEGKAKCPYNLVVQLGIVAHSVRSLVLVPEAIKRVATPVSAPQPAP
jgi:hypothetical protein